MASKTVVELFDDLDGGRADETVSFALDGVEYEIDLSTANAAALRDVLAEFIAHGHRVTNRPRSVTRSTAGSRPGMGGTTGTIATIGVSKAKPGRSTSPNATMTAEIRRLASESAKKVSEANLAADVVEDDEPDLFNSGPDVVAESPAQTVEQGVGPVPALVIPFQEAGL